MAKPVIGVTPTISNDELKLEIGEAYFRSIQNAGGLPIVMPRDLDREELYDLFALCDGLLFSGGGDIEEERFNGKPHVRIAGRDALRDELELRLVQMVIQSEKPFLGICRGVQIINVGLGGTLYTDIADQLPGAQRHDYYPDWARDHLAHNVEISSESRLAQISGALNVKVNSIHHQGLDSLASGLKATAFSPDGLVEAVELPGHPYGIGVQWHPECLPEAAHACELFSSFVQASAEWRVANR